VYLVSAGVLGLSTAGVQRVVVDASGNVGIGTASPSTTLHAKKDLVSGTTYAVYTDNGAGGAGTNLAGIGFANAGNLKSSITAAVYGNDYMTFNVGGSGTTERMRLDASGNLLVGTTSASETSAGFRAIRVGTSDYYINNARPGSTNGESTYLVYSTGASAYRFYVGMGGTVYATSTTISGISDQRLKENVRELDDGLASVMALKPRKFDWKPGKGKDIKDDRGFIAQEFEQVFPDMIDTWQDPAPEGEEPYKAVNANLIPTLVKAIQEQQEIIEKLEARLAALEAK
jgi:hypothetical protein